MRACLSCGYVFYSHRAFRGWFCCERHYRQFYRVFEVDYRSPTDTPACHPNRPAVTLDGGVMDYCQQCCGEATEILEERDDGSQGDTPD